MESFISTFVNKVDRKGRVSVPATFRSTLSSHGSATTIIAYPSRLPAIECAGIDRIQEMQQRIEMLEQFSEAYENLSLMFAQCQALTIDGEGRVILPESLKEYAAIDGDVAFVGLGAMFQLWNPAQFAAHAAAVRERLRRQGTTLPPLGGTARQG